MSSTGTALASSQWVGVMGAGPRQVVPWERAGARCFWESYRMWVYTSTLKVF